MLCIFKGPTLQLGTQPNGKPIRLDAGEVQSGIRQAFGQDACEHDETIQHRKEGKAKLVLKEERYRLDTKGKKQKNLILTDPAIDKLFPEQVDVEVESEKITNDDTFVSPNCIHVSCDKIGLAISRDDFPEGWAFGNGVTCNVELTLTCGCRSIFSWCVLSTGETAKFKNDNGRKQTLRQLFEV